MHLPPNKNPHKLKWINNNYLRFLQDQGEFTALEDINLKLFHHDFLFSTVNYKVSRFSSQSLSLKHEAVNYEYLMLFV